MVGKIFGKGYAVQKGLELSTGDYVIFQDGDLEYDPEDFSKFIDVIQKFQADMVIGSRFNYNKYTRSFNILNKLGNYVLTFFFNILYNTTFTDVYCCYLCFKKQLLDSQNFANNLALNSMQKFLCKLTKKGKNFLKFL